MTVKRVPLQAATSALSALKLFADGNGDVVANSGVKVGSFTRDMSLAEGTQAITGLGFKPVALIVFANVDQEVNRTCWGWTDFTSHKTVEDWHNVVANSFSSSNSIVRIGDNTNIYYCTSATSDSDGFTFTWQKAGSPTGTIIVSYIAFR